MSDISWQFGERIRLIRRDQNLSQEDFGQQLGLSRQTINAYENDRVRPSLDVIAKICDSYTIDPNWLLTGFGSPTQTRSYQRSDGMNEQFAVSEDNLSAEQMALINYVRANRGIAEKLLHWLMSAAVRTADPLVPLPELDAD